MPASNDNQPLVFLSHNSKDKDAVRPLRDCLEGAGIRCWFDEQGLVPGDKIAPTIAAAMEQATCFLYVVGEHGPGNYQLLEGNHWYERWVGGSTSDRRRGFAVLLPGISKETELRRMPTWLTQENLYLALDAVPPPARQLERLTVGVLGASGKELVRSAPAPARSVGRDDLALLCDRDEQVEPLRLAVEPRMGPVRGSRRPMLIVVQGPGDAAPKALVERLATREFPKWRAERGVAEARRGDIRHLYLTRCPIADGGPGRFADSYRSGMWEALRTQRPCRDNAEFLACLESDGVGLAMPTLDLTLDEVFRPRGSSYLDLVREYWAQFPDLTEAVDIVAFVIVRLPAGGTPGRWFSERVPWTDAAKFRSWVRASRESVPVGLAAEVLPELGGIQPIHVTRWAGFDEVRPHLAGDVTETVLTEKVFEKQPVISMDRAIDRIRQVLLRPR